MQIRCPHCQNGIELVDESDLQSVDCPSCGSQFGLVDVDQENIGTLDYAGNSTIGHFELINEVGRGAFGSVWQAHDSKLDRKVAVKVPRSGQFSTSSREQFLREARAAAQLNHPNIVSVYEVGLDDDQIYIVSDFVDGVSLADLLTAKRLSPRQAIGLCVKVVLALEHAHENGVIHRDLKPANIMLDENNEPFVMDFGLAKRDAGEITMTLDGKLLGI
ncbi:MAG: protein kinase, partial [Planctomycetaceae bacterium]|nr:protein kinase [Planctomycetaceae bacterium]